MARLAYPSDHEVPEPRRVVDDRDTERSVSACEDPEWTAPAERMDHRPAELTR